MTITETHIARRALQLCGAEMIQPGALWTEDSKNANEIRACYDVVRRAELRRNIWRFSTRRTALRAVDTLTKKVTFPLWLVGTNYPLNAIVTGSDGILYISKAAGNIGNDPTLRSYTSWDLYFGSTTANQHASVTSDTIEYFAGELVYIGSSAYLSLINGNADTPPSANWTTMVAGTGLTALTFIYPIGSGPAEQSTTRQVYPLPNGYLMLAPQEPKSGAVMTLGWPRGSGYRDWEFEGNYLMTQDTGVIVLRYIADIVDPVAMDPMFTEGLACRVALSVAEPLTQSSSKLQMIAQLYQKFMVEARVVNGIETGPVEQELDAYIEARY